MFGIGAQELFLVLILVVALYFAIRKILGKRRNAKEYAVKCEICGTPNKTNARFCKTCGSRFPS